ncbi:ATP-binding cassette domain-containing protein [Abyssisolibacter fermentans]|uniref:ATP-binding cassette domain-containing protein n=1 Tax=Abyssisolibacter fermentans TaxID=1766203 RepID=UPI00082E10A5|nr:ABC transporter ATP-binding protein [Abyssisolibacter fermentans]
MKRDITVGAFAVVFASVDSMFNNMEDVICYLIGYYSENFGKVQNYLRFLELPERARDKKVQKIACHGDILLEDVSFSYPLADKKTEENFNIKISKGETIAVVDENGSGKSTLTRLLTGLYLPYEGRVLHNNRSTKEFTPRALFAGISGVFQKSQKYQLSLSDNITISEMEAKSKTNEDIKITVTEADIEMNNKVFPHGYHTMLSREFDGIDLSVGQWQRVAIARGFYRDRTHNTR